MKPCPQWLAEDMFWLAIEVARTNPFKFRGLLAWPFHQFQSAAKHTTLVQTGMQLILSEPLILLMEDIPNNHLGCIKLSK